VAIVIAYVSKSLTCSMGRIKVVIDKVFPLDQIKDALAYSQTGRARGKIVLKVL